MAQVYHATSLAGGTNVGTREGISAKPAPPARAGRSGRRARPPQVPPGQPAGNRRDRRPGRTAGELRDTLVATETELSDLAREEGRAERDVEQVRTRIDRDRTRLDAGQVSAARELATLQSEIESLRRRQGDLEEVVLDLMERREGLVSRHDELTTERESVATQTAELTARRDAAFKEIDEQAAKASDQRGGVAAEVPADLLALYEQIRDSRGVGAAMLRAGRCEGCHLSLNRVDLSQIKASAPDEVVRCEESQRILVRTAESGL